MEYDPEKHHLELEGDVLPVISNVFPSGVGYYITCCVFIHMNLIICVQLFYGTLILAGKWPKAEELMDKKSILPTESILALEWTQMHFT